MCARIRGVGSRLLFAAAENAQNRELYLEGFARVSQDFTVRRSISCLLRITRDPDVAFYSRQPTFCRRGKIDLSPAWCVHGARMQRASARALYVDALDAYLFQRTFRVARKIILVTLNIILFEMHAADFCEFLNFHDT